jgi:glucosyl-3-phosphoglycerate synthase
MSGTRSRLLRLDELDVAGLAACKHTRGLTTSVVLPALDEGPRVGEVVAALQQLTLPDRARGLPPLLDELLVVDGGSRDDTVIRAREAGARVVTQPDSDADGVAGGKGAALQHGVRETSGDLVAFVDADVHDPHPGLALGTLAPLLLDPAVRLVKAAYDRTWQGEDAPSASTALGGGRVTELTVRPLLALLWPELAHLAQPLAGEYAADRALLSSLPFERGYGVEIGLVLDTARLHGAAAIAQVDLGARAHDHQDLAALGRMAAEVLLVMLDRLELEGRTLPTATSLALPQPLGGNDGTLTWATTTIERAPLPPIVSGDRPRRRRAP